MSHKVQTFLFEKCIVDYVSCPYIPPQNGLVKSRNRRIVEPGLTLLFHSKALQRFQNFNFQTIVYIIIRRPISSLPSCMSPFFAVFGKHVDYSSLRVFDCSYLSCIRDFTCHKFESRSVQCIFMGYKSLYKGNLCYHIPLKRLVICNTQFSPRMNKIMIR